LASVRQLAGAYAPQLPGLAIVVVALELAVFDGGYAPSTWYPVAVLALTLLVLAWFLVGRLWSVPRPIAVGLGAFAAFCLSSYGSILWAVEPGPALEGANRALLYLIALSVVAVVPSPGRSARAALLLVVIGASAIAVATLASLPTDGSSPDALVDWRLLTPLGDPNATASFWCIAFWPALALATGPAQSRTSRALRPAALASAGLLAQMALLSQSGGAVLAFGTAAIVFLALTPRRGQAMLALLAVAAVTALTCDTLLAIGSAASAAELGDRLVDTRNVIVMSALALLLCAAVFDGLMKLLPRVSARVSAPHVGNRAVAATAAVLAVGALVAIANSSSWIDARWKDFKGSEYDNTEATGSRFSGSLASGHYDFWRVALDEFLAQPLHGIGVDNFQTAYLRERRTVEEPRHPPSLAIGLVSQVGMVGTAAFLVSLGALLAAARGNRQRADRLVSAALLSAVAMWFVHAQVDSLWAFPALGILAFALLGIAARLQQDADAPSQSVAGFFALDPYTAPTVALSAVVVTAALAVAVIFITLAEASRATRQATNKMATEPRAAVAEFERAARLNPLTAQPLVAAAVVARRLGDRALARDLLRRALERAPDNWFGHFEVALLDATSDRPEAALRRLARARELNPRQPIIGETVRAVHLGTAIDPDAVESRLDRQRDARLDAVGGG